MSCEQLRKERPYGWHAERGKNTGRVTSARRCFISLPQTTVGIPCGFEAVADLETANLHLSQMASLGPGEYFVFDLRTQQVPTRLTSTSDGS
jgi:hypothetical protein